MKTQFYTFLLFLTLIFSSSFSQDQAGLTVIVSGIQEGKGVINVALYDSPDTFTDKPLKTAKSVLKRGQQEAEVTFTDVKAGEYAVAVYHDLNQNDELDTNFFGIPQEPYGFSNNYRPTVSKPSFSKAAFRINAEKQTERIRIQ
jgi:uncharacterized protein (DUF2141 family)